MKNDMRILISGASFAGLSTAYWMNQFGHQVTVVEIASGLRRGGTPVDIGGNTLGIVKRMGIFDRIKSNGLNPKTSEFKNADDVTEGLMVQHQEGQEFPAEDVEIERDALLDILFDTVRNDVEFIFDASITGVLETEDGMEVTFRDGSQRRFDLVFGCDGLHSAVRKLCFGEEREYTHFLGQYFSITIVPKLLIPQDTVQMYNEPDKAAMLNAYNGKTDIILCFRSEQPIPYDYRNEAQQRSIILKHLAGGRWRIPELLKEVENSGTFYFDKLCQIKMPCWTKGRVALVGDAGYCASPAAGMGGSLAIDGAAALADAFKEHAGNVEAAFEQYNRNFRPFIERIQAEAEGRLELLNPRTEQAIRERNTQTRAF